MVFAWIQSVWIDLKNTLLARSKLSSSIVLRIQAQYLEQQQLTKNVKEDEQKLVQSFKKLMVEQRGKMLKVPPGQQFALKTFHDYVWNRGADGQPMSWVINITGKKAKETTIQMRVGKENDWKSGQVYLFFTRFLPRRVFEGRS